MYQLIYLKKAAKDYKLLKSCGLDKKVDELLALLAENPFAPPPEFEKLVGDLNGAYSRRINIKHRLVYQVIELPHANDGIEYAGYVKILRMWAHYE